MAEMKPCEMYWCKDCHCFVDKGHRCQQWETTTHVPEEAINQIRQEAQEKCAIICDEIAVKHWQDYKGGPNRADMHYQGLSDGADECAIAIRNMEGT